MRLLREYEVPHVRRVERAAEDAEPCARYELTCRVVIAQRVPSAQLLQDEIVAVDRLLRGARHALAHGLRLEPLDAPQLRRRVVDDPLADRPPVGVVAVEGDFKAGDAVDVVTDGHAIGKGIVNYSAAELRSVKGLKTDEVRARMPRAAEEAVHRDYFVLA